ncbi:carbohydrate ABC transporter permease [Alicyclobacillus fodiniaquatilis]|uniref:Carbohydrate ABC transporter permease n=1 Tax=Alicyclobacillus fodiniaquatilis TaxID=1661150 RepID=A0ABW4JLH3_9BACL
MSTVPTGKLDSMRSSNKKPSQIIGYYFVGPALIIIVPLVLYPLVVSLIDSFRVDNLLQANNHKFIGFGNYADVLKDSLFLHSDYNTLVYLILTTVGSLILGLVMAFWLKSITRYRALFLVLIVLPWAVPGTVAGILWSFIYNPTTGLLNSILMTLHVIKQNVVWFNGSWIGLVLITLTLLWQIAPITAIIFLAGLESIPPQLYESAEIDGSRTVTTFLHITLPLLRPSLAIGLLDAGVLGIGVFDQIYVLAGYSPGTKSAVMQIYLYAFQNLNFGAGISASIVLTVVTLLISLIYLRFLYKEVVY